MYIVYTALPCTSHSGSTCKDVLYITLYTTEIQERRRKLYLQSSEAAALSLLSGTDRGNALTERPQSSYYIVVVYVPRLVVVLFFFRFCLFRSLLCASILYWPLWGHYQLSRRYRFCRRYHTKR